MNLYAGFLISKDVTSIYEENFVSAARKMSGELCCNTKPRLPRRRVMQVDAVEVQNEFN